MFIPSSHVKLWKYIYAACAGFACELCTLLHVRNVGYGHNLLQMRAESSQQTVQVCSCVLPYPDSGCKAARHRVRCMHAGVPGVVIYKLSFLDLQCCIKRVLPSNRDCLCFWFVIGVGFGWQIKDTQSASGSASETPVFYAMSHY